MPEARPRPASRLAIPCLLLALLAGATPAHAQYVRPEGVRGLPAAGDEARVIRDFWASLKDSDFDLPFADLKTGVPGDLDGQLRTWALSLDVPRVGGKRAMPSVTMPGHEFTLANAQSPSDQTMLQPGAWPEPLAWLTAFAHAGNPYAESRAARLRAFVVMAQDLLLVDEQHEHSSRFPMWRRADWFGPHLLMYAYTYPLVRPALPPNVRAATEALLKKMAIRVCKWGPKGEETYLDMTAVVGLILLDRAIKDAELSAAVDAYAKLFFTPGPFFHPAGYFPDQGCFDPGFNGLSLYFATWAALASDKPWIKDAVARAWRLRGYLALPEPDASFNFRPTRTLVGPTHMTLRTGSDAAHDQWDWPFRAVAGAYLTDDAICQAQWPTDDQRLEATNAPILGLNAMLHQNPQDPSAKVSGVYIKNEDLRAGAWGWRMWPNSGDFPMVNLAWDYYPKGFSAHMQEVTRKSPDMLKLPFERAAAFSEWFGDAFFIAKTAARPAAAVGATSGFIVHTGPVSRYPGKELLEFPDAPYGLSGGGISAYWTATTGSVILGRRGGMHAPGGKPTCLDDPAQWRNWPVHAVIGSVDGKGFFTSARIESPALEKNPDNDPIAFHEIHGKHHKYAYTAAPANEKATRLRVSGAIPATPINATPAFKGKLQYERSFAYAGAGLAVKTRVSGDGVDQFKELYEAIPVFHRDQGLQPDAKIQTAIDLQTDAGFVPAATAWTEGVSTIRLTRLGGAVILRFDRPRRVKLSPAETGGGFLSGHVCRSVLIDLLENNDQPAPVTSPREVTYTIAPMRIPGVWPAAKEKLEDD